MFFPIWTFHTYKLYCHFLLILSVSKLRINHAAPDDWIIKATTADAHCAMLNDRGSAELFPNDVPDNFEFVKIAPTIGLYCSYPEEQHLSLIDADYNLFYLNNLLNDKDGVLTEIDHDTSLSNVVNDVKPKDGGICQYNHVTRNFSQSCPKKYILCYFCGLQHTVEPPVSGMKTEDSKLSEGMEEPDPFSLMGNSQVNGLVSREKLKDDPVSVFNFLKNLNTPETPHLRDHSISTIDDISDINDLPLKALILAGDASSDSPEQVIWLDQTEKPGDSNLKSDLINLLNKNAYMLQPSSFSQPGFIKVPLSSLQSADNGNAIPPVPSLDTILDNLYGLRANYSITDSHPVTQESDDIVELTDNSMGQVGTILLNSINKQKLDGFPILENFVDSPINFPQDDDATSSSLEGGEQSVIIKTVVDDANNILRTMPTVTLPNHEVIPFDKFVQILPAYLEKDPDLSSITSSIPIRLSTHDQPQYPDEKVDNASILAPPQPPGQIIEGQKSLNLNSSGLNLQHSDVSIRNNDSLTVKNFENLPESTETPEVMSQIYEANLSQNEFQTTPLSPSPLNVESAKNSTNESYRDASHSVWQGESLKSTLSIYPDLKLQNAQGADFAEEKGHLRGMNPFTSDMIEEQDVDVTNKFRYPTSTLDASNLPDPKNSAGRVQADLPLPYKSSIPENTAIIFSLFILLFTLIIILLTMLTVLLCSNLRTTAKCGSFNETSIMEKDYFSPIRAQFGKFTEKLQSSNTKVKKFASSGNSCPNDQASTTCPSLYTPTQSSRLSRGISKATGNRKAMSVANEELPYAADQMNDPVSNVKYSSPNFSKKLGFDKILLWNRENSIFQEKGFSPKSIFTIGHSDSSNSFVEQTLDVSMKELPGISIVKQNTFDTKESPKTPQLLASSAYNQQDLDRTTPDLVAKPNCSDEKKIEPRIQPEKDFKNESCWNSCLLPPGQDKTFQEESSPNMPGLMENRPTETRSKGMLCSNFTFAAPGAENFHVTEFCENQQGKGQIINNARLWNHHMITFKTNTNTKIPGCSVSISSPSASHCKGIILKDPGRFTTFHLRKQPSLTTVYLNAENSLPAPPDRCQEPKVETSPKAVIWQQMGSPSCELCVSLDTLSFAHTTNTHSDCQHFPIITSDS